MVEVTQTVFDRMESYTEFAAFVLESEAKFKRLDFSGRTDDEPLGTVYTHPYHPKWSIRIAENWDRSKTTISFPGEEIDDE